MVARLILGCGHHTFISNKCPIFQAIHEKHSYIIADLRIVTLRHHNILTIMKNVYVMSLTLWATSIMANSEPLNESKQSEAPAAKKIMVAEPVPKYSTLPPAFGAATMILDRFRAGPKF